MLSFGSLSAWFCIWFSGDPFQKIGCNKIFHLLQVGDRLEFSYGKSVKALVSRANSRIRYTGAGKIRTSGARWRRKFEYHVASRGDNGALADLQLRRLELSGLYITRNLLWKQFHRHRVRFILSFTGPADH